MHRWISRYLRKKENRECTTDDNVLLKIYNPEAKRLTREKEVYAFPLIIFLNLVRLHNEKTSKVCKLKYIISYTCMCVTKRCATSA